MAIKGSLKEASLPDVIQLLFLGRRTGCLALADQQNFGTIYFDEGNIIFAAIVNRRDRLGDLLLRSGRISAGQLQQAVNLQGGEREQKLGEILVQQGAISRDDLQHYMRINPEYLLLEGARRVDEWSLIEKKIPSFDLIFSVDGAHLDESAPELSAEQRALVPLLDGTRDVSQLMEESGLVEFEVGKALFGLITAAQYGWF